MKLSEIQAASCRLSAKPRGQLARWLAGEVSKDRGAKAVRGISDLPPARPPQTVNVVIEKAPAGPPTVYTVVGEAPAPAKKTNAGGKRP
jgi:hypothetical protein